jgi:hypothetical protein
MGETADSLGDLALRFNEQATHLIAVWIHRLLPVCDEIKSLAAGGRILLGDGSEAEFRRILHPALDFASAQRLADNLRAAGARDEGPEWERVVRDTLGNDYFEILVKESEESHQWHVGLAESSRAQVLLAGFVALNGLLEWWYQVVAKQLTGTSSRARDRAELTRPFARALGVDDLRDATSIYEPLEEALRLVVNDIKHHGGLANQSADILKCPKGDALPLHVADLHVWTQHIVTYVATLTDALVQTAERVRPDA